MNSENRRVVETKPNEEKVNESGRIAATKRLQKELMAFVLQSDSSITAFPDGDNLFRYWISCFRQILWSYYYWGTDGWRPLPDPKRRSSMDSNSNFWSHFLQNIHFLRLRSYFWTIAFIQTLVAMETFV